MATIAAVLDACVLYPARLRDVLLSLAAKDLFRPLWSATIHEEWIESVLKRRHDLTRAQLERTRDLMDRAFPSSMVRDFESIIPTLSLPDSSDRHVLASAIRGHADLIVTININDFPSLALKPHVISAVHPDLFADFLFSLYEEEALGAIAAMRARLRAPSMTSKEVIDSLEKVGMRLTCARLRKNQSRI